MNINEDRIRKNTEGEYGRAYSQETYPKIFLEKNLRSTKIPSNINCHYARYLGVYK